MLLTVGVLAFPTRLLSLSPEMVAAAKIIKGILFITILFVLMYREGLFRKAILLKRIEPDLWFKLLPILSIIAIYIAYFWYNGSMKYNGSARLLLLTLGGTLIAATAEEIVFRGYIYNLFKKYRYSFIDSLLISSALFSIIHLVNIFRFEDVWAVLNQLIFAFSLGMLFGSIYALTKNLLLMCLLHFFMNIPSSVKSISNLANSEFALARPSLSEELFSTFFFILLMLPVWLLVLYYMRIFTKTNASIS